MLFYLHEKCVIFHALAEHMICFTVNTAKSVDLTSLGSLCRKTACGLHPSQTGRWVWGVGFHHKLKGFNLHQPDQGEQLGSVLIKEVRGQRLLEM